MYVSGAEYLGVLGLSWQEKLASDLFAVTQDPNLKLAWFLIPLNGTSWDVTYINNIEAYYKEGSNNGLTGDALGAFIKTSAPDISPTLIDSYINLRPGTGNAGAIEAAVENITAPVAKAAGTVVQQVATPLANSITLPLLIIAGIAGLGILIYFNSKKR